MTSAQIDIQLIAAATAAACAIPGVFLVLRRMAMMSDAISHSILLGIVLAYFVVDSTSSPFLIAGAALVGLLTVVLVEALQRTGLVKEDAAIGLVFPLLFSVGVILIARFADNVHLDIDSVLLGELAFAPFDRVIVSGWDLGPRGLWIMGAILAINLSLLLLFFKELKLATFDAGLAASLGLAPVAVHYGLMSSVSLTAVGAFDAVGSILVVALMIGPPAAAYLLTDRLTTMIWLSMLLGVVSAIAGYWLAHWLDASIAGAMATMVGVTFLTTLVFSPSRGLVASLARRRQQKLDFAQTMLAIHLLNHEGTPLAELENRVAGLDAHLHWDATFTADIVARARRHDLVLENEGLLVLTPAGRTRAQSALVHQAAR
ncbi:MAG: metal ABC transporter permease [Thermomicrobiales bacterium]|nr:metal ABC transporter permease [Thermomicrobiales bacterium]